MPIILHITRRADWEKAAGTGGYEAESLARSGFIHCSKPEQVVRVADGIFRGQKGLVLLVIDTERVKAEIRHENLEGGTQLFPHIYGLLNLDAVVDVVDFVPGADGCFALPAEVSAFSGR